MVWGKRLALGADLAVSVVTLALGILAATYGRHSVFNLGAASAYTLMGTGMGICALNLVLLWGSSRLHRDREKGRSGPRVVSGPGDSHDLSPPQPRGGPGCGSLDDTDQEAYGSEDPDSPNNALTQALKQAADGKS